MKKYIIASTLLAAGTLFANAETVLDVNSTSFNAGNSYTYTVDELTFSIKSTGALRDTTTPGGTPVQQGWFTNEDMKSLLFQGDNAWAKDIYTDYIAGNKGDNITIKIAGFDANQGGISLSFVTGCVFEGPGSWASYAVLNDNNSGVSGTAQFVGNGASDIETVNLPMAGGTVSPFGPVVYSFSDLTANESGEISFTVKGVSFHSAAIGGIKVIPEPSAFGLLAGVGALALVASRRRRK
jgi:hypothetical protein